MTDAPLWQIDATHLALLLQQRVTTPKELLESVLDRLERVNPLLNAVITQNPHAIVEAAESARRLASGAPRSRLEGIPVTVKDNLLAKGMYATWGSRLFERFVPEKCELPVARLRNAGAVVIGKTNVPEFTVEGYTSNLLFGTTVNPWDTKLTPGGSSGGAAAAVASGLGPIALGTDGGGSIRRPAAYTGLVGFKPSIGRIPRVGGFPRILLDLEVGGPLTRTVSDARLVLDILAGADRRDHSSQLASVYDDAQTRPLRILYVPRFGDDPVDLQIATSVNASLPIFESLGHRVETRELPFCIDAITRLWPLIGQVGVARVLAGHSGAERLVGPTARAMGHAGSTVTAPDYLAIVETLNTFRAQVAQAFSQFDLMLTPAAAALPWAADQPYPQAIAGRAVGPRGHAVFSGWVNACGHPAISLPCTPSSCGLPIGLQLVGRFGEDELLLDLASAYERAAPWAHRWPALAC